VPQPTSEADAAPVPAITGYRAGDLLIDLGRAIATRDGQELALPRLSFDLLVALARAAPNVATVDELMRQVWPKVIVNPETLAQRVKLLRTALGDDPQQPRYVLGVRGRGYRLACAVDPVYESSGAAPIQGGRRWRRSAVLALLLATATTAAWFLWRPSPQRPAVAQATTQPSPRSIAVLPFKDLNGDREDDILALGIPEGILHQLASLENLDVIARTSSFSFQGHDQDIRTIGQQLGARYILEGSVQRDKQRLRVTAQLVDAQTGGHIWSMQFDKTPQNIFEMQDAIALDVARALSISLQPGAEPMRQGSTTFDAYLEYLQATKLLDTWRWADMKAAAIHATRAIALDSRFADAFVLLAQANVRYAEYDTGPDHKKRFQEALPPALTALNHALELNPRSSSAYAERGYIKAFSDLAAGEADLRKALELNASNVQAIEELAAVVYENPARRGEALVLIDRALKLDPLEPRLDVIKATYLFYGRSDIGGAEKLLQDALQRNPMFEPALSRLAEVYWCSGRLAEAIKVAEQAVAADATAVQPLQILQNLYLDVRDLPAAEQVTRLISPPSPVLKIALLLAKGKMPEAGSQALRAASLADVTPIAEPLMVAAIRLNASSTGQYQQAIDVLGDRAESGWDEKGQLVVADPSSGYLNVVGLGDLLIQSGQEPSGRRILEATLVAMDHEATVLHRGKLWQSHMRAVALALLGRNEDALAELHTAIIQRHSINDWWYLLEVEPAFEKLRQDPRFQDIVRFARTHSEQERNALMQLRATKVVPDRSAKLAGHG